jgi:protein-disulfide isomerase
MLKLTRRATFAAFAALALSACGQADTGGTDGTAASGDEIVLNDITFGSDDAPIVMTEYASWTCGACLQFHDDVVPMLKTDYIDTGKVKLIFREFPTAPASLSVNGFLLARCSGEANYYGMLEDLFEAQPAMLGLARSGGDLDGALREFAAERGFAGAKYDACIEDEAVLSSLVDAVNKGDSQGVNSTPTVFINGQKLPGFEWRTADGMKAVLDARLAELEAE